MHHRQEVIAGSLDHTHRTLVYPVDLVHTPTGVRSFHRVVRSIARGSEELLSYEAGFFSSCIFFNLLTLRLANHQPRTCSRGNTLQKRNITSRRHVFRHIHQLRPCQTDVFPHGFREPPPKEGLLSPP